MSKPLEGVRILDLSTILMGPMATQILLEYGADVLKVEPLEGDVMRHSEPKRHPLMGPMYLHANRGKRSIALDLKKPEAREIALQLAASCDIVVHNVRPAAMKRLGLGYEDFRQRNESIIHVSLVGFGQNGPYATFGAVDDVIQGSAGLAGLFSAAYGSEPTYVPMVVADRIVGLTAAHAMLAAIVRKHRDGTGADIEVPMFETLSALVLSDHLGGRTFTPPAGPMGYPRLINPHRKPYRTTTGYLSIVIYTDSQWNRFVDRLGDERLRPDDQRFNTAARRAENFHLTYELLGKIFSEQSSAYWIGLLQDCDIPCVAVNSLEELVEDPQLKASGLIRSVSHPTEGELNVIGSPVRWSNTEVGTDGYAPNLGEHSREILAELGYAPEEIEDFSFRSVFR